LGQSPSAITGQSDRALSLTFGWRSRSMHPRSPATSDVTKDRHAARQAFTRSSHHRWHGVASGSIRQSPGWEKDTGVLTSVRDVSFVATMRMNSGEEGCATLVASAVWTVISLGRIVDIARLLSTTPGANTHRLLRHKKHAPPDLSKINEIKDHLSPA
jgi:hypothetical protein